MVLLLGAGAAAAVATAALDFSLRIPGHAVLRAGPRAVTGFGRRCQSTLVSQHQARRLARRCGAHLEGLAGTEDGVVGALAAVGLVAEGNDGRVVQIGSWPDDLAGPQDVALLRARGVEVHPLKRGRPVERGTVDVGKHLRPNYRQRRVVLYAEPAPGPGARAGFWRAVRRT